jgi:hypothetical protein
MKKNKFGIKFEQLYPPFQGQRLLIYKNCINKVYDKFNCASINKKNIFYFREFIEFYLIKGQVS